MWVLFFAAAMLVYIATGNEFLDAAIPCVRAGWSSARTGCWILRSDPRRSRAWACFLFYLATAFWAATLTAIVSFMIFMPIALSVRREPDVARLTAIVISLLASASIFIPLSLYAVVTAYLRNQRLWISPVLFRKCRGNFHALKTPALPGEWNLATYVVLSSLVGFCLFGGTAALIFLAQFAADRHNAWVNSLTAFFLVFGYLAGPFLAVVLSMFVSTRVAANTRSECWPTHEKWPTGEETERFGFPEEFA